MNAKNKGLIIELTSLLDVILIMLFWVMMNSSGKAEQAEENARIQAEQADAQIQQIKDETSSQLETMDEYVKTVEGFENGEMLSISINFKDGYDILSFAKGGEELSSVVLNEQTDVEDEIRSVLDKLSADGKIILCALIYDGDTALYRDVVTVREVLELLRDDYGSFYFAYINTSI